jgi:precorrin-3B synthase
MRSGDGLLVRVRPRAGAFSLSSLRAIATVSARFGSGEIDLTNRGNLQIRGVAEETFDNALAALDEAGLLDASVEAESVRNVVVDPLSGLDPARADIRGLATLLENALVRDRRLWSLPGKFGFSFSGVAAPQVGGRNADIMVSADGDCLMISLDGAANIRCEILRDHIVESALGLALAFNELKENDPGFRRMRDAVARLGVATLFAMAGLKAPVPSVAERGEHAGRVGLLSHGDVVFGVGAGLPFGRIVAAQLDLLCDAAAAANANEIYAGSERVLVLPSLDSTRADELLRGADAAGLITRAGDVRLAMDVCPGSPACKNSSTDTRRDAQRFADSFGSALRDCSVHISGCEKGCARRAEADFTLVGRGGHYDIIRNGSASSSSVQETIDADDIGVAISRLILEPTI